MNDLSDKRAIVCGSTQGIGLASAQELAERGAAVTLVARNAERLQVALDTLPSGAAHHTVCVDFESASAVHEAVKQSIDQHGPAHILVNNTGGPPGGPIAEATPAAFEAAFSSHLLCNQLLAQATLPGMAAAGYGRIINIISTSVKQPIPGLGVSNTIRGAVASWAKTLSGEVGRHGVTVNNVLPGFTATGRLQSIILTKAEKSGRDADAVRAEMIATIPAGRLGEAHEIAAAVGFLASPAASYISGVSLPVDGGRLQCL
jgi:3-oxoacyl-[acyl-carrier protein] reductase